jgi:hypothetical protein
MFHLSVDISGVIQLALLPFLIHNVKSIFFFFFSYIINESNLKYFCCTVGTEQLKRRLTKTKIRLSTFPSNNYVNGMLPSFC